MDAQRGSRNFDTGIVKKYFAIPLVTGLPGLGKTTFCRVAFNYLSSTVILAGDAVDSSETLLRASNLLAPKIWENPSDTPKTDLLYQLLAASTDHRNLRIAPMLGGDSFNQVLLDQELSIAVLTQWMKYMPLNEKHQDLSEEEICDKLANYLRHLCSSRGVSLTFVETAEYIISRATSGTAQNPAAIIINIDEAQNMGGVLRPVLELLVRPILTRNIRVFVTVSGISQADMFVVINKSSIAASPIILPLLKLEHMTKILSALFNVDTNDFPRSVLNALRWLGGVPRFLEYFLASAAIKARATTLNDILEWFMTVDFNSVMDAIVLTQEMLVRGSGLDDILDNIFSIAISERSVPLSCSLLVPHVSERTIEWALSHQLLYWDGDHMTTGKVIMPPLLLNRIHLRSGPASGCPLQPLKRPSVHMTPDDNEALVVSVMLHKLKAAKITGNSSVYLSELVGKPLLSKHRMEDITLTVPDCFDLTVLANQLENSKFNSFKSNLFIRLAESTRLRAAEPVAFLNARGAPFADAVIFFPSANFIRAREAISNFSEIIYTICQRI